MKIVEIWKLYEASPMYCKDTTEKRKTAVRTIWTEFSQSCWSRPVKSLTSDLIADWLCKRCKRCSNKTYNEYLRIIRQVINAVLSKTGLTANPANEVPVKRKNSISRKPYTKEEIEQIIATMERGIEIPYHYRTHGKTVTVMRPYTIPYIKEVELSILLGAYCGMRLGDAVAVERGMWDGQFLKFTPSKTEESSGKEVTVPVFDSRLVDALEACEGHLTPNLLAWHGHNTSTLSRLYHRVFEACGFRTRVECEGRRNASTGGFYALRHSYITLCAEAGADMNVVKDVVGHTSRKTTEIYLHISNIRKAKELSKILGATNHG